MAFGSRPDSGRVSAVFRPDSGRIPAGFRLVSGWFLAGFRFGQVRYHSRVGRFCEKPVPTATLSQVNPFQATSIYLWSGPSN